MATAKQPQRKSAASTTEPATQPTEKPPSLTSLYLLLYNAGSLILWASILGRLLLILPLHGRQKTFQSINPFLRTTQTLACLEILHAVFGLVRAAVTTTAMQVASRLLLVWGILYQFPAVVNGGKVLVNGRVFETFTSLDGSSRLGGGWEWLPEGATAFVTLVLAWSVTECVRYAFFAVGIGYGSDRVPGWLVWLRYNAFFVLYPLGISSECYLVYLAIEPAKWYHPGLEWALKLILFVYIPGSYILFTHMMAQRRKVMRGLEEKKNA